MDDPRDARARHPSAGRGRDRGRVIVGVDGSLASLGALRRAVAEARQRQMPLCAVRVVPEVHAWLGAAPLDEADLAAFERHITAAFADALGGYPPDLAIRTTVMVGSPGPALVSLAHHDDDLLVVGSGDHRRRRRSVSGYCVRHARCPVLAVPLPALARAMRRLRLPRGRISLDMLDA
jgi:nucleotide-binding universal stress UspA family protein